MSTTTAIIFDNLGLWSRFMTKITVSVSFSPSIPSLCSMFQSHVTTLTSTSVHYYYMYQEILTIWASEAVSWPKLPLHYLFSPSIPSPVQWFKYRLTHSPQQLSIIIISTTARHFLQFGPLKLFPDQNCHFNLFFSINSKSCLVFQVQVNALTSRRIPLVTGALEVRRLGGWGWGRATAGVVLSLLLVWELRDCSDAARAISFLAVLAGRICFLNSWKIGEGKMQKIIINLCTVWIWLQHYL